MLLITPANTCRMPVLQFQTFFIVNPFSVSAAFVFSVIASCRILVKSTTQECVTPILPDFLSHQVSIVFSRQIVLRRF